MYVAVTGTNKPAASTGPEINQVKDAYIIAVEDEAKKRLEKISSRHQVVPVDMTKLSHGSSASSSSSTTSTTRAEILVDCRKLAVENPAYEPSLLSSSSHHQFVGNGQVENTTDMNGFAELDTPRKGKKKDSKRSSKSSNNSGTDSPFIETISGHNVLKRRSQNSLNRSRDDVQEFEDSMSDAYMQSSFEVEFDDSGPHREMAIDCPDDFPPAVKSPPRYPPPPHSQSSSTRSLPRAPPSTPAKSLDLANNTTSTDNTLEFVANSVSNGHQNLSEDQVERIRKHQEELRKRRDEEIRRAQEQEFLRTSLRRSKKLQALETSMKQTPVVGVVNTAYEENDDEVEVLDDGFGSARGSSQRDKYMKKNIGVDDLFSTLHHIQSRLNAAEERDELSFLKNLFHSSEFQNAVHVHSKITDISRQSPPNKPECTNAVQISNEVFQALQYTESPYSSDLMDMLSQPGLRNLLRAHDSIAEQTSKPAVHENVDDLQDYPITSYGEDTVRIVYLEKTSEPLGATVRNDGEAIIIGRIVKGGTAEKSGLLHEGDEILEVNGAEMRGKNINDVSDMLADMTGTITFMIIPSANFAKTSSNGPVMHVKALSNYDPEDDILIPCRELGISFMKGDILHVINQEDPNWWQAYREGEEEHQSLAGLIPSRHFRQQVEANRKILAGENKENQKTGRSCACGKKDKKKKKKSLYRETDDTEEALTYEEVVQYYPQPNKKRPIVLIGPPNVGRHELRQRLMESDLDRFAAAVPHTSRPQEEHEVDGKDYHFVPRAIFEADIIGRKFIEQGEFQKSLYGTTFGAVRQVINQGRICILNLHAETLRELYTSDLKPYVILVYPQNMEKLRQIQQRLGQTKITDEDLKDTVDRAREMEDKYGHLVDFILVNSDMDLAYEELLKEINRIEVEPQWVPAHWLTSDR
ncbi:MAGUK p55 subfamily member 5-like [Mizuhopecten yessoensis]|uniref:MAGUK p55 subfamily member 5-like n=1 Tax=Mizuhopecten yessoensis TaxID=6573 RepID=UPI000B458ABB|nr:MAGUK p55 subfamily member 5-like [Mizuhopecten yessoensis]